MRISFVKYQIISLVDFPQLTESFWMTREIFCTKPSFFAEVELCMILISETEDKYSMAAFIRDSTK